jgi:hypothetical protein
LFLAAVSNLGPRLPVERISKAVNGVREARLVVIDGAQDFVHVSADIRKEYCDLYLAGCHKWLGAYHPMGLAFYGRPRSKTYIETMLAGLIADRDIDDPLLRFASQLELNETDCETETVNLAALFSCQGAVAETLTKARDLSYRLSGRLANLDRVMPLAAEAGWQPVAPCNELRTGILLVEAEKADSRLVHPDAVRQAFFEGGVAVTTYAGGLVRLSMPDRPLVDGDLHQLKNTFRSVTDRIARF